MKRSHLLLALGLLLTTACSGASTKSDDEDRPHYETLTQSVTMFNEALHWGSNMEALNWSHPQSLAAFSKALAKAKGARLLEVEVESIQPLPGNEVLAQVNFVWTPAGSIVTETCVMRQSWKPSGKVWVIRSSVPEDCKTPIFEFEGPKNEDLKPVPQKKRTIQDQ